VLARAFEYWRKIDPGIAERIVKEMRAGRTR
jgi:hypothetical protein